MKINRQNKKTDEESFDKFDMAMSGMGRTLDRARVATFSKPYMRYGKLLMIRAADKHRYVSLADLDKPECRIAYNKGGLNDRFAHTEFKHAQPAGYPSNELGLNALLQKPAAEPKWNGPYLKKAVPLDPWGNPYLYKIPGQKGDFDLISLGRDGQPVLACGTPGGDQQDQWQLLFLLRHLAGGQSLQEAIDAPMWHTTSFPASFHPRESDPGVLVVEDRLSEEVRSELAALGHRVRLSGPWSLGRMCAVSRDPATGVLAAGANSRGMQGYASGR